MSILSVTVSASSEYWQQTVNYKYEITLADDLRTITGTSEIEYINNSPDTLKVIYLKAFANSIQKGSYADLKNRTVKNFRLSDIKPENEGSCEVRNFTHAGRSLETSMDNTVITVLLVDPIGPGETTSFSLEFTVVLPQPALMRMGVQGGTTKAAYWHPALCVYDRELGWVNNQYLGAGEWYGDYGQFDVTITLPEDQIVAATGVCVNESDMLPPDLRAKLDISNYLKPRAEWPELGLDKPKTKTWHYVAENVPDFVFTTSNNFCIDSDSINGVEVIAYPLRHNAFKWTKAVTLGQETVETFSGLYIPYQWPVVRICDAYGGMEYPMLTNCSNRRGPDSKFFAMLIYHEVGHFWFMGHIGSNQTDRPFLDEGFTTHAEHVAMEKYLGRMGNYEHHDSWFERTFYPQSEDRNIRGFRPLLQLMRDGYDKEMVFSYDQGEEYWPFRVSAYYKTAAMHYSLRSILGDSTYFDAMRHYCRKWLFKHPYADDFTEAMEEATGLELTEYMRQWYYLADRLDYAFDGMKKTNHGDSYSFAIKLKNRADFVAPIDVAVIWEHGDTTFYTISPEGMAFTKPGHISLPTWHQFRRPDKEYSFTVKARRKIKKVVVDPHELLMDINRLNNASGFFPPIELRLDNLGYDRPPLNAYRLRLRPDFWYDTPNGFQLGMHSHGSYLEEYNKHDLEFRMGTKSGRPTIDYESSTPFAGLGRYAWGYLKFVRADIRTFFATGFFKRYKKLYSVRDQDVLKVEFNSLTFDNRVIDRTLGYNRDDRKYLDSPDWFGSNSYNVEASWASLRTFKRGRISSEIYSLQGMFDEQHGFFDQESSYRGFLITRVGFEFGYDLPYSTKMDLRLGREVVIGNPPGQYMPRLSRKTSVEAFTETSLFRSPGAYPSDWADDFYLANNRVRGYQDRDFTFTRSWSGSFSLTTPDMLPYRWFRKLPLVGRFLSRADQALFVDLTYVKDKDTDWAAYSSAGLSISFPSLWDGQSIRLDFPVYLNQPLSGEEEFDFRFSVGWVLPGLFD